MHKEDVRNAAACFIALGLRRAEAKVAVDMALGIGKLTDRIAALEDVALAARALLRRAEGISPDDLLGSVLSLIEWIEWPELRDALDVLDNKGDVDDIGSPRCPRQGGK